MTSALLDLPFGSVLLPAEVEFLAAAGIRSAEQAYALLDACPSLDTGKPNAHLGIRRELLMRLLEPGLPGDFVEAVNATHSHRGPIGGGAATPTRRAIPAIAPLLAMPAVLPGAPAALQPVPFTTAEAEAWLPLDQGTGPTCVPHAALACVEFMRAPTNPGNSTRLSVRFLYQRMGRHPTIAPPPGAEYGFTKLSQARDALAEDGICAEQTWRDYGSLLEEPSSLAIAEARGNLIGHGRYEEPPIGGGRSSGTAGLIHAELLQKRPVAIALPGYSDSGDPANATNWNNAHTLRTGEVADPVPTVQVVVPESGHAVCLVGFQPGGSDKLGGYFVFRNSRGNMFGESAPLPGPKYPSASPARGYGTISAWHVENYVWEWLSLKL